MDPMNRFTCEEAFRRLDDYLDRELSPEEMAMVREHLETCTACTREFTYEVSLLTAVRRKLQRIDLPPGMLDRINRALDQQ